RWRELTGGPERDGSYIRVHLIHGGLPDSHSPFSPIPAYPPTCPTSTEAGGRVYALSGWLRA
ncbi:MAG: hypothetical protein M3314_12840, partial [Actinomycetota bacterium]|nr:hypothetical protein [Actinomycetota bacterium]